MKASFGRRALLLAALQSILLAAALPGPGAAAAEVLRFKMSHASAYALWSTFPQGGPGEPGVVYEDAFVAGSEVAVLSTGERYDDSFAYVAVVRYTIDESGRFVWLSGTFGWSGGDAVDFRMAGRLTGASLTASMDLTACTPEGCVPAGPGSVDVDWTGTGDPYHVVGNSTSTSKAFTFHGHFNGTFRRAEAQGTVLGTDRGTSRFATLFRGNSGYLNVCHHC